MDRNTFGSGAKSVAKGAESSRLSRIGIDKGNILGKRTAKPAPILKQIDVATVSKKTAKDPYKQGRALLMPMYAAVMKEAPHIKLTSPERRKVLNAVVAEKEANMTPYTMGEDETVQLKEAIKRHVGNVMNSRGERMRKTVADMDLADLLTHLSMENAKVTKKRPAPVLTPAMDTSKREKLEKQAADRALRYQKREQLREKLEQLKSNHNLDMDVDVIVQGMGVNDMNTALTMNDDDLLNAFKTLKFGGKKYKKRRSSH